MFRKGHRSVWKPEATLCSLAIKSFNTGNWWLIPKKALREQWLEKLLLTFSTWSAQAGGFQNSPWSFHNSGCNWLESNELSVTLAQGCLSSIHSSLGPYNKGESSKCSSWLLFKAKETLEGVVVMPSWSQIIQTGHVTQISQRHRRERELQSFWKKAICW